MLWIKVLVSWPTYPHADQRARPGICDILSVAGGALLGACGTVDCGSCDGSGFSLPSSGGDDVAVFELWSDFSHAPDFR